MTFQKYLSPGHNRAQRYYLMCSHYFFTANYSNVVAIKVHGCMMGWKKALLLLMLLFVIASKAHDLDQDSTDDEEQERRRLLVRDGFEGWLSRRGRHSQASKTEIFNRLFGARYGTTVSIRSSSTEGRKTARPRKRSTPLPSSSPSSQPSSIPSLVLSTSPTYPGTIVYPNSPILLSFEPGNFSNRKRSSDGNIVLSNGLSARPIARAGQKVPLASGGTSQSKFHNDPDGAAIFQKEDGGWYYASNAENPNRGSDWQDGGVGVIEFDAEGQVIGYRKVCSVTSNNCGGGRSPWGSWITCEEIGGGRVYQTDPSGNRQPVLTALGNLGMYESFAYDDGTDIPTFYVTRDTSDGVLTRFRPDAKAMECYNKPNAYDRWCTLNSGSVDYLLISGGPSGQFVWTTNYNDAKKNAKKYYPNSEGIDIKDGTLYFVSKAAKRLVNLNLRKGSYTYHSTRSGAFENQPDQITRIAGDDSGFAWFCEDGGRQPGVFGRNQKNEYFTVLYGDFNTHEETTGLGFCPERKRMYVSFQNVGIIYEVTRDDGRPFDGAMVDIKYHAA